MKQSIATGDAPEAIGPYSQAVVAGGCIYTAGQIPLTPDGDLVTGSIEDQTHQVMWNLEAILQAAGSSFEHVVKTTIYVTDISQYRQINAVYGSYFAEPYPARELVCVQSLPLGANIEISMVAALPQ